MALTVVWLVEQLLDGQFPGQQEVGQGLAWGAVLQQHDGTQGFGHRLVRARPAAQQGLALLQDGGSATGTSWESPPEPRVQVWPCGDCQAKVLLSPDRPTCIWVLQDWQDGFCPRLMEWFGLERISLNPC